MGKCNNKVTPKICCEQVVMILPCTLSLCFFPSTGACDLATLMTIDGTPIPQFSLAFKPLFHFHSPPVYGFLQAFSYFSHSQCLF